MEFDESRPYVPGDDVRHFDWNATARTGEPFVKRFREEREAFFEWLEDTAARNAQRNVGLSDEEVLVLVERAREEVARAAG